MHDESSPVRSGDELDWSALEARLRQVLDLPDAEMTVRQFTGGRANLTYLVSFADQSVVVRRPPRGNLAPGAHDMAREHRVLSRIGEAYPRAPRALYFSEDTSIIGAPFIVTEYRRGCAMQTELHESMVGLPDATRQISNALVDAAADLHLIEREAIGLGDLGRPDGYAERQVRGWSDRWARVAPDDDDGRVKRIGERLFATIPRPERVSIVHNDLKLDNCQFEPGRADRVTSVFDWDMAATGDPLFDLGMLIVSMSASPSVWSLTAEEAATRYQARSGIDATNLPWYLAFGTWRTAVVVQQLYRRFVSGDSTDPRLGAMGAAIPSIVSTAEELLPR